MSRGIRIGIPIVTVVVSAAVYRQLPERVDVDSLERDAYGLAVGANLQVMANGVEADGGFTLSVHSMEWKHADTALHIVQFAGPRLRLSSVSEETVFSLGYQDLREAWSVASYQKDGMFVISADDSGVSLFSSVDSP